jgi:hypothetical protein
MRFLVLHMEKTVLCFQLTSSHRSLEIVRALSLAWDRAAGNKIVTKANISLFPTSILTSFGFNVTPDKRAVPFVLTNRVHSFFHTLIHISDEQEQTLSSGSLHSASSLPKGGDVIRLHRLTSEDRPRWPEAILS